MTAAAAPAAVHHRVPLIASVMAVGAGTVWSFGTLFARLAKHSDAWQYLLWRSIGLLIVMELVSWRRRGPLLVREAFTSGRLMLIADVSLLAASLGYVYAVKTTTAANAAFLASITPLVAVVLARIALGERLTAVTIGAIGLATAGLLVMVMADVNAGNMVGNISALLSSVGFAGYSVCVRSAPRRDWSPVMPGYATIMIVLCAIVSIAKGNSLMLPWRDLGLAVLHGGVLIAFGTTLFNKAAQVVPAVAMTVFAQSETVFAPFWVFLVLSEQPKPATLFGALMILGAVVGKAVLDARGPAVSPAPHV